MNTMASFDKFFSGLYLETLFMSSPPNQWEGNTLYFMWILSASDSNSMTVESVRPPDKNVYL